MHAPTAVTVEATPTTAVAASAVAPSKAKFPPRNNRKKSLNVGRKAVPAQRNSKRKAVKQAISDHESTFGILAKEPSLDSDLESVAGKAAPDALPARSTAAEKRQRKQARTKQLEAWRIWSAKQARADRMSKRERDDEVNAAASAVAHGDGGEGVHVRSFFFVLWCCQGPL
jgi:hypothetical protein